MTTSGMSRGVPYTASPVRGSAEPAVVTYNGYGSPTVPMYAPHAYPSAQASTVRTICISGFPQDVRERELHNLLFFLHGYQGAALTLDAGQVRGLGLFIDTHCALAAAQRIDGHVEFEAGCWLRAELAREDLRFSEPGQAGSTLSDDHQSVSSTTMTIATTGSDLQAVPGAMSAYPAAGGAVPYRLQAYYPAVALSGAHTPPRYAPVKNEKDNPPCNTLFIGNLGEGVDEQEVRSVFGAMPGYLQSKVVHSARGMSAFIEFADIPTAAACHNSQQGLMLASSNRGPIRLQYSKNPFGRKRDAQGSYASLPSSPSSSGPPSVIPRVFSGYALAVPTPIIPSAYTAGMMYGP